MKNYLIFIFIFLWLFSLSLCDIFCRYKSVLCASFKLLLLLFQARERGLNSSEWIKKERKSCLIFFPLIIERSLRPKNDDDDNQGIVSIIIIFLEMTENEIFREQEKQQEFGGTNRAK